MKTELDWSNYHDQGMGDAYADIPRNGGNYAKAISVCIRSQHCQQTNNNGVMCPSFRISNDEKLSPGGRVSLLKGLLNQNDHSFLFDADLEKSLSSCVSCKGCKRECENNLDIAAIKAEYLAQRRASGDRSVRSWLFAYFPHLLLRYPILAKLIKLRNRSLIIKKLAKLLFKINDRVPLPEPANVPFSSSLTTLPPADNSDMNIVLLVDTFTALFHPEIALDAEKVLSASGYHITTISPSDHSVKNPLDTGRSLFSQGYIANTRDHASDLINLLHPHIEQGKRIVGLEPSALLMLRDEYLMLELGEKAKEIADSTLLFEEFIAREHKADRFKLNLTPWENSKKVLVHGHCHQKAVGAMKSMRKALRLVPNLNFEFIEASCCGMAGSFGLEAEHAQESIDMAELGLLPALRENPDALVVCNGFSCSHQIFSLTGRKTTHLASLLCEMIS